MNEQQRIERVRFRTLKDAKTGANPIFPPVQLEFTPDYIRSEKDWNEAEWEVFYQLLPPHLLKTTRT